VGSYKKTVFSRDLIVLLDSSKGPSQDRKRSRPRELLKKLPKKLSSRKPEPELSNCPKKIEKQL
jgi:hypothetical protein